MVADDCQRVAPAGSVVFPTVTSEDVTMDVPTVNNRSQLSAMPATLLLSAPNPATRG